MKLLDQSRALVRLLLFNSERDTVSEQARIASEAARAERRKTTQAMDQLLASLTQTRVQNALELRRGNQAQST